MRYEAAPVLRKTKAAERRAEANAMQDAAKPQAPAPMGAALGMTQSRIQGTVGNEIPVAPVLERLKDGRFRLTVTWGPRGHLYVVKRTPSGASVLPPVKSSPKDGSTVATFLFPAEGLSAVDVYVLNQEAPDPASLPEGGDVPGVRRRVYPE
jgi:hypothetical protein